MSDNKYGDIILHIEGDSSVYRIDANTREVTVRGNEPFVEEPLDKAELTSILKELGVNDHNTVNGNLFESDESSLPYFFEDLLHGPPTRELLEGKDGFRFSPPPDLKPNSERNVDSEELAPSADTDSQGIINDLFIMPPNLISK